MNIDYKMVAKISPVLRMLIDKENPGIVIFKPFDKVSFEHVKALGYAMVLENTDAIKESYNSHTNKTGAPSVVALKNLGFFCLGENYKQSAQILEQVYSGGSDVPVYVAPAYKRRVEGKIAIITGAAQGFGKGLAEGLAKEGAHVVIADLNLEGAEATAKEINSTFGSGTATAVQVDVSKDESVQTMVEHTVATYGGLDIMLANAGIVIAGDLTEMTTDKFNLVTAVNYTGYFLCAKYASVPMKLQTEVNPNYWTDIIEINSKSGLEGSKKNFAYAGSKFGGLGLTQSFALELVDYSIKVNAICPGNLLDGPLWSDPEKGLFKQYFESGKVPGAKSIEDVREFYLSKVPMHKGCTVEDVVVAALYVVEQKNETGQAIPVTGGQVMLN